MSEKRNDLQGIRGIAILLVLVFHLMPNLFPNGFIGVDMFFVLSGYLMTMILSKKLMNSNVLLDFYSRRFRRIVPLFYCILTAVYIVGWFILIEVDKQQLLTDLKWSLTFTSNMQTLFELKGYWDQVVSFRFLVHCWSLGVEIQFYLIAPFILGYCREQKWNYLVYMFLILSCIFQLISPPKISYGLLFSRVWQFLCGTVAYEIENYTKSAIQYTPLPNDEISLSKESKSVRLIHNESSSIWLTLLRELLVIGLVAVLFVDSNIIGETGFRILGVFLTTTFICTSNYAQFSFVSSKPLVYIGDISYTLYLVHWPVIVFYKYYHSLADLSVIDIFWCVSMMFVISILVHHTLEDFLVGIRLIYAFLIVFGCILFILSTSSFYANNTSIELEENIQIQLPVAKENVSQVMVGNQFTLKPKSQPTKAEIIANAILINAQEDARQAQETNLNDPSKNYYWVPCHRDFEAEKWTNWTLEPTLRCVTKSNGTLNVLVMGNSIAYRAFPTIHDLFKGRFNTMRLLGKSTLPGIYSSTKSPALSTNYEKAMKLLIQTFKPDIIFAVFTTLPKTGEGQEGQEMQAPVTNWTTDPVLQHLQRNFDFYSNYSRKIVIDLPYYINTDFPGNRFAQEINKRLKLGKPLDNLKVTRQQVFNQQHWQHERLRHINCSKCIFNDIGESLFDGDTFYLYDRETYLAIISDGIHLSQAGLKRVRKQYGDIIEKVIRELN